MLEYRFGIRGGACLPPLPALHPGPRRSKGNRGGINWLRSSRERGREREGEGLWQPGA